MGDPEPAFPPAPAGPAGLVPAGTILSLSAQILWPQQLAGASVGSVLKASDIPEAGTSHAGRGHGTRHLLKFIRLSWGVGQVCVCVRLWGLCRGAIYDCPWEQELEGWDEPPRWVLCSLPGAGRCRRGWGLGLGARVSGLSTCGQVWVAVVSRH